MDGERVDAAFELADKCFVDHAVALEPALPAERLRHDIYPEVSLPALAMSGMPNVLVGFVHHVEARGSESLGQLLRDEIAPCHGVRHSRRFMSSMGDFLPDALISPRRQSFIGTLGQLSLPKTRFARTESRSEVENTVD